MLNLVDNPGFAVGLEHETAGTIRRGGEWMSAAATCVAAPSLLAMTIVVNGDGMGAA